MKNFIAGIIVGSALTAGLVGAGDYWSTQSEAQQSYDYFRQRALQLDIENLRREQFNQQIDKLGKNPC